MQNVWQKLKKPILALAPMEDVTDFVFRRIVHATAPADIYFTEFTSADGFCSPGREHVAKRLRTEWSDEPRPLIAQIWGTKPENHETMARELVAMGFDGIDINMGCPVKDIVKAGCGAALIDDHERAAAIIAATKRGADGKIPVSVKTRIGVKKIATETWVTFLLQQGIDALTIHGRTQKEMSKVPAHWDEIAKAVKIRDSVAPGVPILGNGDVLTRQQGEQRITETGVDGVMIGRGIFSNIFAFEKEARQHTSQEYLDVLLQHLALHEKIWQGRKPYEPLKKYFKIYIRDFVGASELRVAMMETRDYQEAREVIARWQATQAS